MLHKDVELILTSLTENHLANEGVGVRDGEEAFDYRYRQGPFKLGLEGHSIVALIDLKLPKINRLAVLERLKADADIQSVQVVMRRVGGWKNFSFFYWKIAL